MLRSTLTASILDLPVVGDLLARLAARPSLVGLTYHRIGAVDELDPGLVSASMEDLDRQIRWLKAHVRLLSPEEVLAGVRGDLTPPGPSAFITFDDGYADNLEAARLLARHGVRAFFFVTSGFVGSDVVPDWDRLAFVAQTTSRPSLCLEPPDYPNPVIVATSGDRGEVLAHLKRLYRDLPPAAQGSFVRAVERAAGVAAAARRDGSKRLFMTWDEVREVHAQGHTIGAHTHTHPRLARLTPEAQRQELAFSKAKIESELDAPISSMAYPFGKRDTFTDETKRLAAACGYAACFSFYGGANLPGDVDPMDVRRIAVERDLAPALLQARVRVSGLYAI